MNQETLTIKNVPPKNKKINAIEENTRICFWNQRVFYLNQPSTLYIYIVTFRISMYFETLLRILSMCSFHDKFSSTMTPSIVHCLNSSLMLRFSLFCLGLKTMKFDLIIFIESLLAQHQSVKWSNSSFNVFLIKFKFWWEEKDVCIINKKKEV